MTTHNRSTTKSTDTNTHHIYEVAHADLPLHCPTDSMTLWNSHPRVYLAIEATGKAKCPYCGADYILRG